MIRSLDIYDEYNLMKKANMKYKKTYFPKECFTKIMDYCGESYQQKRDRLWKGIGVFSSKIGGAGRDMLKKAEEEGKIMWGYQYDHIMVGENTRSDEDYDVYKTPSKHCSDPPCSTVYCRFKNDKLGVFKSWFGSYWGTIGGYRSVYHQIDWEISVQGYYRWLPGRPRDGYSSMERRFLRKVNKIFKQYRYYKNKEEEKIYQQARKADNSIQALSRSARWVKRNES